MGFRKPALTFLLLLLLPLSSCFGIDRSGGIMKYRAGTALTGTGSFHVSRLPPPWKGPKIRLKQLIHENDPLQATIVTDALCGPKYDDGPLPKLAAEMFQKMTDRKIASQITLTIDGRSAYRMRGQGRMDGVLLEMDVVVLKKNLCLYDMVYVAPPAAFSRGEKDFEDYIHGFQTN